MLFNDSNKTPQTDQFTADVMCIMQQDLEQASCAIVARGMERSCTTTKHTKGTTYFHFLPQHSFE